MDTAKPKYNEGDVYFSADGYNVAYAGEPRCDDEFFVGTAERLNLVEGEDYESDDCGAWVAHGDVVENTEPVINVLGFCDYLHDFNELMNVALATYEACLSTVAVGTSCYCNLSIENRDGTPFLVSDREGEHINLQRFLIELQNVEEGIEQP